MKQRIVVLTGPTASGKTKLAIKLAKEINAEIICADSRIVYKNLDIVSAKPTLEEREGIEHHLISIIEPEIDFSAGDFVNHSKKAIEDIVSKGKNVIVSGGTWFYIKSLLDEKELPNCPIDKKLREELQELDTTTLWNKLNSLDSKRAALIHPNNKDKVIRSIEMCIGLNKPISLYKRKENKNYEALWYMVNLERNVLYERINERVDCMVEMGLYDEWVKNKKLYPTSKVLQNTIGYKEFYDLEKGIYSSTDEAIDKIKQHTRNFSKRQLTYFRSNQNIKQIQNIDEILGDLSCQIN